MKPILLCLRVLFVAFFISLAASVPHSNMRAYAQSVTLPDYSDWSSIATRAESVLEARRASNVALGELRSEVAQWRTDFVSAQSVNQTRIATLVSQLEALGPMPEEGTPETDNIAERRTQLTAQLNRLSAPQRTADEAYSRADGIIGEIDEIMRDRQSAQLTKLGPSPLNFANWPAAYTDLTHALRATKSEITQAWSSATQQKELRQALPLVIFYLVLGFVFLTQGRQWMENLTKRVQDQAHRRHRSVFAFAISLGQVILPVIGIMALVEALFATKLLGFRGQVLAESLPLIGIAFFGARWLSMRLFPKWENRATLLGLESDQRARLRLYAGVLGLCYGVFALISSFNNYVSFSSETYVVLEFPIMILTGFILYRCGKILIAAPNMQKVAQLENNDDNDDSTSDGLVEEMRPFLAKLAGRALMVVGVVGPVVAAIGYFNAANAVVYPMLVSAWLLGLLLVLQAVTRQIFALVTGLDDDEARDALLPVIVSFALTVFSLPLFALAWGVRVSDLTELWTRFSEGVAIGDTRISPSDFIVGAVVFAIAYGGTRLLQSALRTTVLPKTDFSSGRRIAIVSGVGYVGVFLAGLIGITVAGIDLSKLAIVAGALSIGVGFGLQNIVSNFVSGIILLVERPVSEGDWIEVGGKMGIVQEISVRSTRIETFDRRDVIIPNADLVSGVVTNWTRGNLLGRVVLPVGVAYGTDTRKVEKILLEIAKSNPLVALNPAPYVIMTGFGADSLDFEVRAILRDVNFGLGAKSDLLHEIARRFGEEGIEIPFAQRDVWLRNPETLQPVAPTPKKPAAKKPTAKKTS